MTQDDRVVVRAPRKPRGGVVFVGVVIAYGYLVGAGMLAVGVYLGGVLCLAVAVFLTYVQLRDRSLRVVGETDRLVVRNLFGTRVVPRAEIEAFRIWERPPTVSGRLTRGNRRKVVAVLRDGSELRLGVTNANPFLPETVRRLEPSLTALQTWLEAG